MTEALLHLTSGKGPAECRWVVAQLAKAFAEEAVRIGVTCEVLDPQDRLPASLLMRVAGEGAIAFAKERTGTVLWVGHSHFRPRHKRRNWFVGVAPARLPDELADLRDSDVDFQAMRASGPGGQHVNKTDSAVRATHRPTGLVVTAQEQRSQHANRKLAMVKLAMLLDELRSDANDDARQAQWASHQQLERGNAVRTYTGPRFKLKATSPPE